MTDDGAGGRAKREGLRDAKRARHLAVPPVQHGGRHHPLGRGSGHQPGGVLIGYRLTKNPICFSLSSWLIPKLATEALICLFVQRKVRWRDDVPTKILQIMT